MPRSVTLASDYSQMVADAFLFLFVAGGMAILLGAATSAVLVSLSRRKSFWFFSPVFAVGWFGLILGVFELVAAL
jgi:hypothetical protein